MLITLACGAGIASAQQRDAADAGPSPRHRAPDAAAPADVTPAPRAEEPEAPPRAPEAPRDPCAEVLRAVQFEDVSAAERAWAACRQRLGAAGRVPGVDEIRAVEDATEALHGLRREDGAFCVTPSAPFDFGALVGGARDTAACFAALDRFLTSDSSVWRFVLADAYASGRLATRASYDVAAARRTRARPPSGGAAERELVAVARLAGRHFMRTCRCLEGPQPDSVTAVRAMHLPSTVESVLLRGLEEREGAQAEP